MTEARIVAVGSQSFHQQVARALSLGPDAIERVGSVTAAEEALGNGKGPADVLVLSPSVKDPDAVGLAEYVSTEAPTTAVVIVRERAPDGLVPTAMRAGVRDVVDLSRGSKELSEALEHAVAWATSLRVARGELAPGSPGARGLVISVFSSKGGTGKTFLASNLAVALAQHSGQETALVDMDLSMGDVFSYFGREPERQLQDLLSLGEQEDRDGILALGTKLADHLWGFAAPADPAVEAISGEAVGRMVRALRGAFPQVVVDTPAGYSDQVLASLELSDSILMVAGLDVIALRHLSMALSTLMALGVPRERLRIVLNRADSKVGLAPGEVERVMDLSVDAMIPSSRMVPTSLNRGEPVVLQEPRSGVTKAIAELAARMVAHTESTPTERRKRRLFRRG